MIIEHPRNLLTVTETFVLLRFRNFVLNKEVIDSVVYYWNLIYHALVRILRSNIELTYGEKVFYLEAGRRVVKYLEEYGVNTVHFISHLEVIQQGICKLGKYNMAFLSMVCVLINQFRSDGPPALHGFACIHFLLIINESVK